MPHRWRESKRGYITTPDWRAGTESVGRHARHVAICTIARVQYLVSWNFKHLANVRRESGFNSVNLLQGYPPVRIVPPSSLIHGYDQEKDL